MHPPTLSVIHSFTNTHSLNYPYIHSHALTGTKMMQLAHLLIPDLTYSLTDPSTHSIIHWIIYTLIHVLADSPLTHSLNFTHSLPHRIIYSPTPSNIHTLTDPLIHIFILLLIPSFTHPFTCSHIHPHLIIIIYTYSLSITFNQPFTYHWLTQLLNQVHIQSPVIHIFTESVNHSLVITGINKALLPVRCKTTWINDDKFLVLPKRANSTPSLAKLWMSVTDHILLKYDLHDKNGRKW